MPTTRATLGYGAIFYLASVASPLGYTAILEMSSIEPSEVTTPKVKATHLLSPNRTEEYISGLLDPSECTVGGNFVGETSQTLLDTSIGVVVNYKITAPIDGGTKTFTRTGTGYVSNVKKGPFVQDQPAKVTFKFQTSGLPTDTVA